MTLTAQTSRTSFNCTGLTAFDLPADFIFWDDEDLKVSHFDTGGVETVLELTSGFTVTGGGGATGTVTTVATYADGTLVVYRELALTQDYDGEQGDGFNTNTFEKSLDRMVGILQEFFRKLLGTVRLADTDTSGADLTLPPLEPGKAFKVNPAGTGLVNTTYDPDEAATSAAGSAATAEAKALLTAADALQTALDRVATGEDRVATGQDVATTAQAVVDAAAVLTNAVKKNEYVLLETGFSADPSVIFDIADLTPDFTTSNVYVWDITANRTLNNPAATVEAGVWYIYITPSGAFSLAFGAAYTIMDGTFDPTAGVCNRLAITSKDGVSFLVNIEQVP